jgi:hypothetical protein
VANAALKPLASVPVFWTLLKCAGLRKLYGIVSSVKRWLSSMVVALKVATVFLVSVDMATSLAHALEFPGKLRLDERTYLAVQTIYYPGFTLAGIAEILSVIATLVLMIALRNAGGAFWWAMLAFIAVSAMHAVFWFVTQPVNKYWLKNQPLGKAGARLFAMDHGNQSSPGTVDPDRTYLRNRWEYSHVVRAVLASIALIALAVAISI